MNSPSTSRCFHLSNGSFPSPNARARPLARPQSSREVLRQKANHVAAHDHSYLFVAEPLGDERVGYLDEARGVEGLLDRAVEVGAERDVFDSGEVSGVTNRARDGARVRAAGGRVPVADAYDASRRGDAAHLLVAQVAYMVASAAHARVRVYDGARRDREHVVNGARRGVRNVDEHAARLHPTD